MPDQIEIPKIKSLDEFIKTIINIKNENQKPILWFRGHENQSWGLQPTLYWKLKLREDEEFWDGLKNKEKNILDEFRVRNYHLLEGRWPENEYMWLCLMQHYGTATRLLDWSEQALIGLFFSVESFFKTDHESKGILPCVWVLQPQKLIDKLMLLPNDCTNETCKHKLDECPLTSYRNGVIPNLLTLHGTETKIKDDYVPVPVISPYNNERIHSQSGVFTLFPNNGQCVDSPDEKPNDFTLDKFLDSQEFLQKIVILKPKHISDELKKIGYKRSLIYPEIPNVSVEIEEHYLR